MDKVTECLDALIEEMRESRGYQNYLWMEEELEKDPDLKSRVDDYRIRNYRLQQSENVDLYESKGERPCPKRKGMPDTEQR